MISQTQKLLESFLRPTEDEIFAKFLKLPGAQRSQNKGSPQWVYIPGKRPDRVLCVAHADTVHDDKPIEDLIWIGDVVCRTGGQAGGGWGQGGKGKSGPLGADDRAGCAMMYDLFDGAHSLLVTTGEERGLIGARAAVSDIGKELEKHQFAVQVDRHGDRQAVFYDVGTDKFKAFITSTLTSYDYEKMPWREWDGSSTDIKHICGEIMLCGVNLSAGFWHEHSEGELLLLGAWLHTRTVLKKLLKQEKLSQFKFQRRAYTAPISYQGGVQCYDHTRGRGGSMYVSETEKLIKLCETPDLSGKKRKKIAKLVRKFTEKGIIQRWQAVRMLDKLYPTEQAAERSQQIDLLPAVTPIADSYFDRYTDSVCYCGAKESDSKGLHKLWCHKAVFRPAPSGGVLPSGSVRVCAHDVAIAVFCKQCDETGTKSRLEKCVGCGNIYVHKAGCALATSNKLTGQDDGFCGECYYNLTVVGHHADGCSFSTNSRVKVKPKVLRGTVQQEVPALEVTICCHECPDCKKSWKHTRLPLNIVRSNSRGCLIQYIAGCPQHSKESAGFVQWYEVRVKEAMDRAPRKEPPKALPSVTDPHDVSARLMNIESCD